MQLIGTEHFITVRLGCTDMDHIRNGDISGDDRLRKCNVAVGRVLATIAVKSNKYYIF